MVSDGKLMVLRKGLTRQAEFMIAGDALVVCFLLAAFRFL